MAELPDPGISPAWLLMCAAMFFGGIRLRYWVVALLILWTFILTRTRYGRHIYAVGGNAEAARRAGINVTANPIPGGQYYGIVFDDEKANQFGWAGWVHWETSGVHLYAWEQPMLFFSVDIYTCKAFDPVAAQITFNALDPAHRKPIVC